jgi:V-type H+-transporting ATPase subunit A
VIAKYSQSVFVPRGVDVPPLNNEKLWEFKANPKIQVGSMVSGGDVFATVFENNLFYEHKIMLAPRVQGKVTYIAPDGNYTLLDKVIEVEYDGVKTSYGMSHKWPVR